MICKLSYASLFMQVWYASCHMLCKFVYASMICKLSYVMQVCLCKFDMQVVIWYASMLCKFGDGHMVHVIMLCMLFWRKNVIGKCVNTWTFHMPPCWTCGFNTFMSWLCQVPSFYPLCAIAICKRWDCVWGLGKLKRHKNMSLGIYLLS